MLQNNPFSPKITAEIFGGLGYFVSKQVVYNNKGTGARERRPRLVQQPLLPFPSSNEFHPQSRDVSSTRSPLRVPESRPSGFNVSKTRPYFVAESPFLHS